jgi:hypothetical protein
MPLKLENIPFFDWALMGLIAANICLIAVLTFFPSIHNRVTNGIIHFIKKL